VSESGLKLIVWLVAASLTGAMLAIPQPVDPWEMPSLVLDRTAVSDAVGLDETLADEAPDSTEAQTLRGLFLDHGRSEANPPYERLEFDARQTAIHFASGALVEKHGAPAVAAMRASAVEEFIHVLGDGSDEERDDYEIGVLGGIRTVLETYGVMRDGVLVAPPLTARVFYKARWNSIHRRPFTEGFSQVELQAYWGWLALHGWGKALDEREDALVEFRDAGGFGTQEAAALFDMLRDRPDRAAKSLETLYEASGQLRLRNLGLGALHATLLRTGSQ
jgi:hypothetical protein